MNKILVNLSQAQEAKLRNGHTVRITPKMVGSGAELIVDPLQFNNLNKHLAKNKGMLISLNKDLVQENQAGGSLLAGLKKSYSKLPEGTRSQLRKTVKQSAKDAVDVAVDTGFSVASANPYTAPVAMAGKVAYDQTNARRGVHRKINKFVDKSGMGSRGLMLANAKASGLYAGMGTKAPAGEHCLHCGSGMQKELFLLEQQNAGVEIERKRGRPKKIQL
jgi:hypothetical protein